MHGLSHPTLATQIVGVNYSLYQYERHKYKCATVNLLFVWTLPLRLNFHSKHWPGTDYRAYFNKDAAGAIVQVHHSPTPHSGTFGLRSSGMPGIHANCDSGIPYWLAMAGAALAHASTHQGSGSSSYSTHTWLHHYHLVATRHIEF